MSAGGMVETPRAKPVQEVAAYPTPLERAPRGRKRWWSR